ncbi:MAG: hypothetical protein GXP31_06865 [Kiritimatiellaeota bacterium]|nr:hypothetical protein [Kiritimatiellota bacterium]
MQATILQPPYPSASSAALARDCQTWMLARLAELPPGKTDLIVLPEYATAPGIDAPELLFQFSATTGADFLQRLQTAAERLNAFITVGTVQRSGRRHVNRTVVFGPDATAVAVYDKTHLTAVERETLKLAPGGKPGLFPLKRWRAGLAVCFDLYFPEYFEALAAEQVDVILCPSYQRSESPERIRLICGCRALDTGAYVLRSGYAMADRSRGGASLAAGPDGRILTDAGSEPGVLTVSFDPETKFRKPASHGQAAIDHRRLIERHRRPNLYRPSPKRRRRILDSPFPRLCAHRGLSAVCPENTVPAFAAAAALPGVHEIEFDLWLSRDGVPVVCHDPKLDRTTNGTGYVPELDWTDIRRLDAGVRRGEEWRGVRVPSLDEVIDAVDGRVGLNIHIKAPGPDNRLIHLVCDRIREYGDVETAYIAGDGPVLEAARQYAPEIARACLAAQDRPAQQIEAALRFECRRIQFGRNATAEHIVAARDANLICNLFWSDEPDDASRWCAKGIQVVLTNAAHTLAAVGGDAGG